MAKFNLISNNFKTGEFSPKMKARTDLDEYKTSCEEIFNMFPMKQGGVVKRSGTKYVQSLNDSADVVKTIPFIFSKEEAYIITLDPHSIPAVPSQVKDSPNYIQDPTDLTRYHSIPAASFVKVIRNDGSTPLVEGDLGNPYEKINGGASDSNVINNSIFYYKPYPVEIFNIEDIDPRGFHYAQSGDILIITHNSGTIPPIVIARTGANTFLVEWYYRYALEASYGVLETKLYYPLVLRNPFKNPNISQTAISGTYEETHRTVVTVGGGIPTGFSLTEGDVNLYDVFTLTANTSHFEESDLNKTIIINALVGGALVDLDFTIVEYISPNNVRAITSRFVSGENTIGATNPASAAASFLATDNWVEASWGNSAGYPKTVCFFEQRLIFGGSISEIDTIWASRTGNIFVLIRKRFSQDSADDNTGLGNFIPTNIPDKDKVVDIFGNVNLETDPLSFKPSSQEINAIQWLSSGQSLMIGTLGAEYVVSGANSALSATSITFRRQTSRGASPVMPVRIDDEVFYVLRDGRSVFNFKFNRNNGSFLSEEITLHADHIVDVGNETSVAEFIQMEYCTSRDLVLAVTTDNYLVALTYNPQNGTRAWCRLDFTAKVLSVCSLPSADGNIDEIWVALERNGKRTLERMGLDFRADSLKDPQNQSLFLDGHVTAQESAFDQTLFFPHLVPGTMVHVYKDGEFIEEVDSLGGVLVTAPFETAIVGIPFDAYLETNDLNAGGEFGTPIGNIQRVDRVTALLYKSIHVGVGHPDGHIDPLKNLPSGLATGNYNIDFPQGPREDGARIRIESRGAFPLTILGIVSRGRTSDR